MEPTDTTTTTSVVEATVVEPTNRPGTCPRYTKIGKPPCEKNCNDDADCKGKQKCCEKHCSRVCVDPLFKVESMHELNSNGVYHESHRKRFFLF